MIFEETTRTLFCGDLLSQAGDGPALRDDALEAAVQAETMFGATALSPVTGKTIRRLAALEPEMLAVMHGSSTRSDCAQALGGLADHYDAMVRGLS